MSELNSIIVLCVSASSAFFIGALFCALGWIKNSLGMRLLSGLLTLVFLYALISSQGTSVFIGVSGIALLFFLYQGRKRIIQRPTYFQWNLRELSVVLLLSVLWFGTSFLFMPNSGSGEVLHHDFLYYMDISWALDRTGVESLVNDPINSIELSPNGYHFFIPWLLSLANRISFEVGSYTSLIHCVIPLLFITVHALTVDFVRAFTTKKSWYDFLIALIPFGVFAVFLPMYDSLAVMQYSTKYSYGMFNSFWSGKLLVSMLIFVPLFHALLKSEFNKAKLLLGTVCFLSIIHVPVILIALVIISGYSFWLHRDKKSLMLDVGLILFLFLYFQLFYGTSSFIPLPKMGENVSDFLSNFRTSIILMAEALIQLGIVYTPILFVGGIAYLKLKPTVPLKNVFLLASLIVIGSSFVWILFKSNFGSSEFFKLAGNLWVHMGIASGAMILLICAIEAKKRVWTMALIGMFLLPTVWAFTTNYTLVGSYYSKELYGKLKKEPLDDQLLLNFEVEEEAFRNLPGQLNPFVHYQMDVLYQTHDRFVVVSGSHLFSDAFRMHAKDSMYGEMVKHDPIYRNWISANKPKKESFLVKLMKRLNIQYAISDARYALPTGLQNKKKKEIRNSEKEELLIQLDL